ncbi:MAG TPA: hypothetical protein VK280_23055 [Streptosporangiaceae bacterium]|nr:hypothetical protein [Streptosporangiaceae bacterium]
MPPLVGVLQQDEFERRLADGEVGVAGLRLAGSVPNSPASAAPSPKFARTSSTSAALAEGD